MQSANDVIVPITSWVSWLRNIWYSLGFHLGLISFVQTPLPIHFVSQTLVFDPWVDLAPVIWLIAGTLFFGADRARRKNLIFYFVWILCHHYLLNNLTAKKIQFNAILLILVFIVILFSTPWSILVS
jgi:hypothetical protein